MSFSATRNTARLDAGDERQSCIDMPELISALSFALDLTEGAVPGHALRSCLLGMRIGERAGLTQRQMSDLYYALLLKDIGCSSNAAHIGQIVRGEDDKVQAEGRAVVQAEVWADIRADLQAELDDVGSKPHGTKLLQLRLFGGRKPLEQTTPKRIIPVGTVPQSISSGVPVKLNGDRGASIIAKIGLSAGTADAVRALDEHWDGSGYPGRWRGEQIPLLARIAAVAQHLDVFASKSGTDSAVAVMWSRSGKWFDPEIVRIAASLNRTRTLWKDCLAILREEDTQAAVLALKPGEDLQLGPDRIDRVCEVFSDVVDAKSPFTVRHSLGVADAAHRTAQTLGLSPEGAQFVRRAALLHDIGKLRVPNSILEKQGKLTVEEFLLVQEHPALTQKILGRIPAFRQMARVAGSHHEKLDGSGYPNNLKADQLSLETRIVAVADVYAALSEERPYRESLDLGQVVAIMKKDIPYKLDGECFEALLASLRATA